MNAEEVFDLLLASCSAVEAETPNLSAQEYFLRVWSSPKVRDFKLAALNKGKKCAEKSLEFRNQGNEAYKNADLSSAIALYSKAILHAPQSGTEAELQPLSLAYGNRSLMLFKTEQYRECLKDIELAFKYGHPQERHQMMFERRVACLRALGDHDGAAAALREATGKSGGKDGSEDVGEKLGKLDLKKKTHTGERSVEQGPWKPVPHVNGHTTDTASISDAIELTVSESKGRHYIAKRDIVPGEAVMVEKPYFHILHRKDYQTHCSNCMRRVPVQIPCRSCSMFAFCGESCEREAWDSWHRIECQLVPQTVHFSEFLETKREEKDPNPSSMNMVDGLSFALRGILKTGVKSLYEKFVEDDGKVHSKTEVAPSCQTGPFNSMMNLKWNDDPNRAVVSGPASILFLKFLKTTPFFGELDASALTKLASGDCNGSVDVFDPLAAPDPLSISEFSNGVHHEHDKMEEFEVYVGATLYSLFQICRLNTITIAEYEIKESTNTGVVIDPSACVTEHDLGSCISIQASLFNHSCYPNVAKISYGNVGVFRASRSIPKGEELCITYHSNYSRDPLGNRRSVLTTRYGFDCMCQPCVDKWPPHSVLPPALVEEFPMAPMLGPNWYCVECKSRVPITRESCPGCESPLNVLALHANSVCRNHVTALKKFKVNGDFTPKLLGAEIEWLKYLETLYAPPAQILLDAIRAVDACLQVQGNCYDMRANRKK